MNVDPYLSFGGNAEGAFEVCQPVFGGDLLGGPLRL